jgi:glycosyltransferase involved in cell wall biosynthesis
MTPTIPLISILLPVANGAEFLFEALQSVINQTFTEWECWVALNGEGLKGPAEAVATAFQDLDNRIHILHLPTATNKVTALNEAVKFANADWIALLDADDRWHSTKLAKQVAILSRYKPAVVGTMARYFGEFTGQPSIPTGWLSHRDYNENPIINSSVILHKSFAQWEYVAPYNDSTEDYFLWLKIGHFLGSFYGGRSRISSSFCGAYNIPEILVDHRIHKSSAFNSRPLPAVPLPSPYALLSAQLASRPLTNIVTTACNSPEYIKAQYIALCRYVPPPWQFIVFNDAKAWPDITNFGDPTMPQQIEAVCRELRIPCISVPNQGHQQIASASHRHCDTLRFVMRFVEQHPGRYWMLDSDMWPVAPYTVEELADRFAGSGTFVRQSRSSPIDGKEIVYAWPNLWWLDTTRIPTLPCWDLAPGCDTCGASANWIAAQPFGAVTWLPPHFSSCTWMISDLHHNNLQNQHYLQDHVGVCGFVEADPRNMAGKAWSELYDLRVFHVRTGSNWNGEGAAVHRKVTELVKSFFA